LTDEWQSADCIRRVPGFHAAFHGLLIDPRIYCQIWISNFCFLYP
jgi:hypothetical protein